MPNGSDMPEGYGYTASVEKRVEKLEKRVEQLEAMVAILADGVAGRGPVPTGDAVREALEMFKARAS